MYDYRLPDFPAELGRGPDSEYFGFGVALSLSEPRLAGRRPLLTSGVRGTRGLEEKADVYSSRLQNATQIVI